MIRALKDASAFSSASGVMMNDHMNEVLRGNTLCSDGTDHQRLRRVIGKLLSPTALKSLQEEITSKAERLVERLVSKGTFCAITELATFLPMDIVASAGGLPRDGRERMLVWAAQMFNCFGPLNDRARGAFTDVAQIGLGCLQLVRLLFTGGFCTYLKAQLRSLEIAWTGFTYLWSVR